MEFITIIISNSRPHIDAEKTNGNHISSSTEDLMLRLDFEKPKNLNVSQSIPNVAPDTGSNGTIRYAGSATGSGFGDNSTYPYHYEVYDRTVTLKFQLWDLDSDKFRFESKSLVQNLSYRQKLLRNHLILTIRFKQIRYILITI